MDQIEEWRPVKNWTGLYEVSDYGHVRNPRKGNRILNGWITKQGYVSVHLYYDGIFKKRPVHQLVAEAFCPNPDGKPFIDHINGIRTDNRASNLRWCTAKENQNNPLTIEAIRRSKLGEKNPMFGKSPSDEVRKKIGDSQRGEKNHWYGKHLSQEQKDRLTEWNKTEDAIRLRCIPVLQYTKDMELVRIWYSAREAERVVGVNHNLIRRCCVGGRKTARGFVWKYPEDKDAVFDLIFQHDNRDKSATEET